MEEELNTTYTKVTKVPFLRGKEYPLCVLSSTCARCKCRLLCGKKETMTTLPPARILAIESSCDETACAVLENGRALLASTVASQMEMHARYGGVFPEVASRQHVLSIIPVVEQTLAQSNLTLKDMDALAVTRGPGLAGSLVVGMNMAKGLALGTGLPLVGVNHLEGHIYSSWIYNAGESIPVEPQFPLMALLVSGGHTELNLMTDHLTYERLGSTQDDAAGEAFDKVARLLGLSYPGGPSIQRQQRAVTRIDSSSHAPNWMENMISLSADSRQQCCTKSMT